MPSGSSKIIQQAKSTYSSLGKVFENQRKIIEYQTKIAKDQKGEKDKQKNANT